MSDCLFLAVSKRNHIKKGHDHDVERHVCNKMGSSSAKISPDQHHQTKWVTTRQGVSLRVKYLEPRSSPDSTDTQLSFDDDNNNQESITPRLTRTKAIFFIHGVAGSADIWESQITYFLSRGYYIIAPDLIGHGGSSAPNKISLYKFGYMAEDCIEVFDHMCKDVNMVVSHSYGTSLAVYLAHHRASRVDRLVLMSGGAPVPLAPQTGILSLPIPVLSVLKPALTRFFNRSAFHKKNRNLPNKHKAFDVPVHVLRHTMKGQLWLEGGADFHKHIIHPTLLLHGEDDKLEPAEGTVEMHQTLQTSQIYLIPEASHMIMMEQPAVVNNLIEKFLTSDQITQNINVSQDNIVPHKASSSHTHLTKSQPNLRRATLTG